MPWDAKEVLSKIEAQLVNSVGTRSAIVPCTCLNTTCLDTNEQLPSAREIGYLLQPSIATYERAVARPHIMHTQGNCYNDVYLHLMQRNILHQIRFCSLAMSASIIHNDRRYLETFKVVDVNSQATSGSALH